MGRGVKYCWNSEMLQCSFHWRCSGRATGGAHELLQCGPAHSFYKPTCGRALSRADRQAITSCFHRQPLFCFQSPITLAILSVSSFVCPLFIRWHLAAHQSHHREPSLVNQLYLPKRKNVWQQFLLDLWHLLLQCTIVTISSSINTFAISEMKLGLNHELRYVKHLTPIERMAHQDTTVYKTRAAFVKNCSKYTCNLLLSCLMNPTDY